MTHFHIAVVSPQINLPSIVTSDERSAYERYQQTVQVFQDLTGEKIDVTLDCPAVGHKTIFADGSSVRIFNCEKSCMED